MRVTGYAYSWDVVDDPGFVGRTTDLGVDEVAVAIAYHTARAATPWQTARAAVVARHAALYRPVRPEVWRSRELRPEPADWMSTPDSAGEAIDAVHAAGLRTAGWLVLTHNSLLGNRCPHLTVRDCFGQSYPWALCPQQDDVRGYAATLAAESVRDLPLDTVILEACGQLGAVHQHMHEKTDAVWSPAVQRLLSICCCPACQAAWRDAGGDPDHVRAVIRKRVVHLIGSGGLTGTDDGLPADLAALVLGVRQRATDRLRAGVLAAIGPGPRIVLHGSPDPWATGALPGLTPAAGGDVDSVVVQCWQPDEHSADTVAATSAALPEGVGVGAYVTAVAPAPIPDVPGYVDRLRRAGATELHLYHLGLAGAARRPDLRAAIRAAKS